MVQSSRFTSFAELGCLLGLSEILDRLSAFMSFSQSYTFKPSS